jgi:hypothetical protein
MEKASGIGRGIKAVPGASGRRDRHQISSIIAHHVGTACEIETAAVPLLAPLAPSDVQINPFSTKMELEEPKCKQELDP